MANHKCVDKLRKKMMAESKSVKWIRFDLSDITTGDGKKSGMTGQRIEYGYTHKKKDGTEVEKQEKSFVTHKFCPFCGKKY